MENAKPERLTDGALTAELTRLAAGERASTAALIAHLAEFDSRRLYLGAGFSSLFAYCREVLRLSEHESYNRIEGARLVRRFPTILDLLARGDLNLTTVRLLAPYLVADNFADLVGAARGRSKREVEEVIVGRFPKPDVVVTIRRTPATNGRSAREVGSAVPGAACGPDSGSVERIRGANDSSGASDSRPMAPGTPIALEGATVVERVAGPQPRRAAVRTDEIAPLSPGRYAVRFTASAKTREKLRFAQDLLRHAVPSGDFGIVIDRALSLLIEDLLRRKAAVTEGARRPRTGNGSSRHIPAGVRREVWLRDGGRCGFVSPLGRRCAARALLEFHHVEPYGIGGAAIASNISLRCRPHNAYESELFFGPARELVPERVDNGRLKLATESRGQVDSARASISA